MQEICACEISKYDSLKILRQGRYQLACQYGWRRLCGVLSLDEELKTAERWKISFSQGLAPQMVIQCQVVIHNTHTHTHTPKIYRTEEESIVWCEFLQKG